MDWVKLGHLMQSARKKSGVKQSDIAKELNVKNNTISNWERGEAKPDIDSFVVYCQMVGVDFKALIMQTLGDVPEPMESIECTASEIEMIRKFRFLDKRAQKVILRNLNAEYEDAEKNLVEDSSITAGAG